MEVTKEEIALQLTLKALECGKIGGRAVSSRLAGNEPDQVGPANMKYICNAYKAALKELSSAEG